MDLKDDPARASLDLLTGHLAHHTPRLSFEIPRDDLVTYVFGGHAETHPEKKIFINAEDENDFITYGKAFRAIQSIALRLKENGLERGDCVCIHSFNHIHYPLFWLGVVAAGGVVTGSNPAYTTPELVHHFKITKSRLVIAHVDRLESVKKAAEECQIAANNIYSFGGNGVSDQEFWNPSSGLEYWSNTKVAQSDPSRQDSTLAAYATTSGTTGLPKAAGLSHRYFVAQLAGIEGLFRNRDGPITQLHCLPVFHAFAAPIALLLPLRLGIATYYLPRFHAENYANAVHRFQITDSAVVPPIIATLTKLPPYHHGLLRSLRYLICAGAPLAPSVQANLGDILHPEVAISQCWGCTEVGWISTFHSHERDLSGSVGYLLPNTFLKIRDPGGHAVTADGVAGEAFIKSESMLQGYQTRDASIHRQELCDEEGFYATGDVVHIKRGRIYIKGRVKDIMKVNGWQVSPDEIQSVIMQLAPQGVLDCAVVGSAALDANGLQVTRPQAYVVRSLSSFVTADDIRAHVKSELVSYKQITGGVVFVDQIPRNATGKIVHRLLEETVAQHRLHDSSIAAALFKQGSIEHCVTAFWGLIGPLSMLILAWLMNDWLKGLGVI